MQHIPQEKRFLFGEFTPERFIHTQNSAVVNMRPNGTGGKNQELNEGEKKNPCIHMTLASRGKYANWDSQSRSDLRLFNFPQ